jgi:phosphoribosylglycinamide formyltransferase-1
MNKLKIAVFASGSGTNFQAILDRIQAGELDAEVGLLVCDRPASGAAERAEKAGVPVFSFRPKDYPNREAYETEILDRLEAAGVDLIVLAGYMRILTDTLVRPFFGRMVNVHPSLLPAFPGINAIGQALAHGVKVTGVTVHFVDGGMDTGPIIAQQAVRIDEGDTEETLTANIQQAEHSLYPSVIQWIAEGRVALDEDGKRAVIRRKS